MLQVPKKNCTFVFLYSMKKTAVILLAAALAAACSGPAATDFPPLLRTVPSRSICVAHFRHAKDALPLLLDSSHVFRRLDLGRLSDAGMVLSYDFSSTLVPLLALDAGHSRGDTSDASMGVLERAAALGLRSAYVVDTAAKRAGILLSPSSAAVAEALLHIGAGTSVLDAPDFTAAAALCSGDGSVIIRNSGAGRLVPAGFLEEAAPRRALVKFLSGACEWTVVNFPSASRKDLQIKTVGDYPSNWLHIFSGSRGEGRSKLAAILPDSCSLVLSVPLADASAFYSARCAWLDANSQLQRHKRACGELAKLSGMAPADWLAAAAPQEIARIGWDGRSVLAVRCRRAPGLKAMESNPYEHFTGVLFGDAFSLPDESVRASLGSWLVIGSSDDVSSFMALEGRKAPAGFGRGGTRFTVYSPGLLLSGSAGGIQLNLNE